MTDTTLDRRVRPAAVAGCFYPGDTDALRRVVGGLIAGAASVDVRPRGLIAPHAGYTYSGPVAASAHATLVPIRRVIRRVVLIGPAHFAMFDGLAAPTADAFETPLGRVRLDRDAIASVLGSPHVCTHDQAHRHEHSLEVHLPFLQTVLERWTLVPLLTGVVHADPVAGLLERLWDEQTLVLVSSDLTHNLTFDQAKRLDRATADAIEALDPVLLHDRQACGCVAIQALLLIAERRGLHAHTLDLRNSAEVTGDRGRIVGYGAWALG